MYQSAKEKAFKVSNLVALTMASALMVAGEVSFATIDPAVSTGMDALVVDAGLLGGIITGAVVGVGIILLGIRLVKRFLPKAV